MDNIPKMGTGSRFPKEIGACPRFLTCFGEYGFLVRFFSALIASVALILLCGCGTSEVPSPETVADTPTASAAPPTAFGDAQGALGDLPLAFEENQGQFDPQALFAARNGTGTFFFTADSLAAVFTRTVKTTDNSDDLDQPVGDTEMSTESFALKIHFLGSNQGIVVEGEDPLQGKVSYFRGKNPEGWVSGAGTFGRIVYRDLWPSIDLAWSGAAGRLNGEYRLERAGDAGGIRLRYEGQDALSLDDDGRLVIGTPWGDLHEEAPRAVQHDQPVGIAYGLDAAAGEVWFELENVDPQAPLVITP
jgi:hypothetical protein